MLVGKHPQKRASDEGTREYTELTLRVPRHLSMSGSAARVWALRNAVPLEKGWRLAEFAFYSDESCMDEKQLVPAAMRDAPQKNVAQDSEENEDLYACSGMGGSARKAHDTFYNTYWVAECCPCKQWDA